MSNMSDFEQWALNNGYCYRDLVKTHEGQYSQPIAIHAYKAFCGAKQSMQGEALAWRRLEDGQWVYYETKAWDDLTELYTHAPDSAARIAEQDAEIARLQKEFEEARKDALEEAAKIVDSWENAASIEGFNTDSISNEIRAAIRQTGADASPNIKGGCGVKRYYEYSTAEGCHAGLMVCEQCKQKITSGDFRYWLDEELDGYRSEHRKCSTDDKQWTVIDTERAAIEAANEKLDQACKAFYDQFGDYGVEVLNRMFPS